MKRPLQIVEISQKRCALRFGTAPCPATGTPLCFNTWPTCPTSATRAVFDNTGRIRWRFVKNSPGVHDFGDFTDADDVATPCIPVTGLNVSTSKSQVNVAGILQGKSPFGVRATVSISMDDFVWDDVWGDFYKATRGTLPKRFFWATFLARNKLFSAMEITVYDGYEGDALASMRKRLYLVEGIDGPSNGKVTIRGIDPLMLADGKRSLFPPSYAMSLYADTTATATSLDVITDDEANVSGTVGITSGRHILLGSEIIGYSGYTVVTPGQYTLTGLTRAMGGTTAKAGKAGDKIGRVGHFESTLLVDAAEYLLGTQTPVAEKPEVKPEATIDEKPKTNSDALKAASERLKAKAEADAKAKVDPKPEAKPDAKSEVKAEPKDPKAEPKPDTNTAAKAVAQEPKAEAAAPERRAALEAPARFNENGKKDWATVPDSVKEEVHRAISENEKGIQKYKETSDKWEAVREYDELARKNGREGVHESLKQIREIEDVFSRGRIQGLKKVTEHFGYNIQEIAAHIMGQKPNQQVQEAHGRVRELEAEITRMKNEAKAPEIVQNFFTEHEDAAGYSDDIAFVLEKGYASTLEDAYEFVKRFKPASNAGSQTSSQPLIPAESAAAHTQAPALNPAGSKSVSGAPTNGISPASKHPVPKTNREALQRAMARAGNA